jgi:hypothetical protein
MWERDTWRLFFSSFPINGLETFSWSSSLGHSILLFDILPYVFIFGIVP